MAYRRPGVTVTQEFANTTAALATFALPCVAVGPAYQLVSGDSLGNYSGSAVSLPYASLLAGALLDTDLLADDEPFPASKLPINVTLKNAYVQIVAAQTDGNWTGSAFTDATSAQYASVAAGDILVVTPSNAVTIVATQVAGVSYSASSQRNRLHTATAGLLAPVEAGDLVTVTGSSPSVAGAVHVTAVSGDTLILDANINDGTADSTSVGYTITGNRGSASAGNYIVQTVNGPNSLALQSPLPAVESTLSYSIKRLVPSTAITVAGQTTLPRLTSPATGGFTADANGVNLPASMTVTLGSTAYPVLSAAVYADYRALRTDLAGSVMSFTTLTDATAIFGANQILPANPLGYAVQVMLQNTVTTVNAVALDENAVDNELLSYTAATETLALEDLYAIAVLSHNPTVHSLFKTHVEALSMPDVKLQRLALFNSLLITKAVLQDDQTTVTTVNNSRIIVNTQLAGSGVFAAPDTLVDTTSGTQFHNVKPGDLVVVQSGTGVTPGNYAVLVKNSDTSVQLAASFITSGSPSNIQYYIVRQDGLSADGVSFYDRNASFLANGVLAGQYLTVASGGLAGRYKIVSVQSDKQLTLAAAIPGVASLQTALSYEVDRDLSKDEQAALVSGYSASFASRRMVHTWPDSVQTPVGQTLQYLPGYYMGCVVAALITGLPSQQGLTNLSVSGFLGLQHSSKYFSDTQLNVIADGGTLIFAQDGAQQPLYVRHQLTTLRSAIKFQELSVTKNVDFIAKFLRGQFAAFIGQYNIVDTTLDILRTKAGSCIRFLKETTRRDKIGGVIRGGTLTSLAEDPDQIDTVNMVFTLNIPIPLNDLQITVQV